MLRARHPVLDVTCLEEDHVEDGGTGVAAAITNCRPSSTSHVGSRSSVRELVTDVI